MPKAHFGMTYSAPLHSKYLFYGYIFQDPRHNKTNPWQSQNGLISLDFRGLYHDPLHSCKNVLLILSDS